VLKVSPRHHWVPGALSVATDGSITLVGRCTRNVAVDPVIGECMAKTMSNRTEHVQAKCQCVTIGNSGAVAVANDSQCPPGGTARSTWAAVLAGLTALMPPPHATQLQSPRTTRTPCACQ
jgi:hypothetical protein